MAPDDLYADMWRYPIDARTAERLLAGEVAPEDAPPGYAAAAALVRAAAGPATDELACRDRDVSAVAAAIGTQPAVAAAASPIKARHGGSRRVALRALVVSVPALVLGATGAAAATGTLPGPAQSAAHRVLGDIGISVPSGSPSSDQGVTPRGTVANSGVTPGSSAAASAAEGLCRAFLSSAGHPSADSAAFTQLRAAAEAAGYSSVSSYCATVTQGEGTSGSSTPQTGGGSGAGDTQTSQSPAEPPATTPGTGPPTSTPATGPPVSTPGTGPPTSTPGTGPPTSTPVTGPPASTPGKGPPASTPASGG